MLVHDDTIIIERYNYMNIIIENTYTLSEFYDCIHIWLIDSIRSHIIDKNIM